MFLCVPLHGMSWVFECQSGGVLGGFWRMCIGEMSCTLLSGIRACGELFDCSRSSTDAKCSSVA